MFYKLFLILYQLYLIISSANRYWAKKAKEKGIKEVYFDRGGYKYHGRVKLFAETLRKNGLKF